MTQEELLNAEIEKRARKAWSKKQCGEMPWSFLYGYTKAFYEQNRVARAEQREVDIQRAVEVFEKFARKYLLMLPPSKRMGRDVKYEVEMFKQAIKEQL